MPRTQITRLPEYAVTDRERLNELLDGEFVAHVGLVVAGHPAVFPTGFARDGDRLLIHGSTGSPWIRELATGVAASVAVTAVDAVVVARSAFESSMRYRSAVIFGHFGPVPADEKGVDLDLFTNRLLPGRTQEVRPPTVKELAATLLLQIPIVEWSMKVSDGWPEDEDEDVASDAWAGVVPMCTAYGEPIPAPDLRPGIVPPPSVQALSRR